MGILHNMYRCKETGNPTSEEIKGQATRGLAESNPKPRRECANQLILSSSTSNWRVELGGITGGKPRVPYA